MALCRPFSAAVSCHCMRSVHARHCRDLKPANILFDSPQNPCLKVCDFGLARFARHLEMTGFVGTPQYMACGALSLEVRRDVDARPPPPCSHALLFLCRVPHFGQRNHVGEVEAGGDAAEGGFMALVRLRQSVIDGLRPAEMEASPYRRKRGFAELGTLNRCDSPCSLAHL